MFYYIFKKTFSFYRCIICVLLSVFLCTSIIPPAFTQELLNFPPVGMLVEPTKSFSPILLTGISVDRQNPFHLNFIIDTGTHREITKTDIHIESHKLAKYFLAAMTVPQDDLWVNLSPYEQDFIIPEALGKTILGRDMLAQDYLLKQLTASLLHPEKSLGEKFWTNLYQKIHHRYGNIEIPIDTFNKVWILPDQAVIYETNEGVHITKSRLKVLLETDIKGFQNGSQGQRSLAKQSSLSDSFDEETQDIIKDLMREIIIPAIETEVNQGENFSQIRQIYHALILAQWYKQTVKENLLAKLYLNQNKIQGVDSKDIHIKDKIYARYIEAFQKGVFDLIQEDYDEISDDLIPRQYFSGGEQFSRIAISRTTDSSEITQSQVGDSYQVSLQMEPLNATEQKKVSEKTNISLIGFASPAQPHLSVTTALYVLSGSVKEHFGEEVGVSIFDMYADPRLEMEKIVDDIVQQKPKMIGMSLVPGTLNLAVQFVQKLKEQFSKEDMPLLVFGNAVANYIPETILRDYFPEAIMVQREGDGAIIELIEYVNDQRKKEDVHNLVYLENQELKQTPFQAVPADQISMDMEAMSQHVQDGVLIQLETSRGCPWGGCLFCASRDLLGSRQQNRKWRAKPIEKVLKEIEAILDQGGSFISFIDEEFIGPGLEGVQRTQTLLKGIMALKEEKKKNFQFHMSSRADSFFNLNDDALLAQERRHMIQLFKQAGLAKVFLGVESGSQTQLNRFNKGLDVVETETAISLLKEAGIVFELGFIMFDPEVTLKEIHENMGFLAKNHHIKAVSWFLNALRIQSGTPFVRLYAQKPEVNLSPLPNPVDLQHTYTFIHPQVQALYALSQKITQDSAKLYYRLKSIYRGGINGMQKEAFQQCVKNKDLLMDAYFASFQSLLDTMMQDMTDDQRQVQLKKVVIESIFTQLNITQDLMNDLEEVEKTFVVEEILQLSKDFLQQAFQSIAHEIIEVGIVPQQTLSLMDQIHKTSSDLNEIILVLKPGGTFNTELLTELMTRINEKSYYIAGVKIFSGDEIQRLDLFEKEHAFAFKVAREGMSMFFEQDVHRLKDIYDRFEFESLYEIPFAESQAIPAYDLITKYGLTEEEAANLWEEQYDIETFMKGGLRGINKVGTRKYVVVTQHPKVNEGRPFLLINGMCIQMKHIAELKDEPSVVLLLKRKDHSKSLSWKSMRENFLGDRSPILSPTGSIRNDAYLGYLPVTQPVPFWKNIVHLSSGPLESLLEIFLWFDLSLQDTGFGKLLLASGYTKEEVEYFLTDPNVTLSNKTKPLFDWTEKMDHNAAKDFLMKVFPPFYNQKAMPTITFKEYLKFLDRHDQGLWGVPQNIVDEKDIQPTSAIVLRYPSMITKEYQQFEEQGKDLIRQGQVGQVLMAGGTGGRWFGYHVPEEKRIRFLADAYEFEGKIRSFAELKLAHNAWVAQQAGGRIPIWIMTSELSHPVIRDFMKEHQYFGLPQEDVSFYTQGSVPRFNPTAKDLKTDYRGKSSDWIQEQIQDNGSTSGLFRLKDNSISKKPMGHFDVIASLVLSRELLSMSDRGVSVIHFTDANNLGTNIDPVLLGIFENSHEDVLHILAEKNRIFTIQFDEQNYHLALRKGVIVESTLPKEFEPVLKDGQVVGIVNQKTKRAVRAEINSKLEKGGTLVDLKGRAQILEGFRFPKDYDQEAIPYFSTAHQLIKTSALLKFFDLSLEEYRAISDEELLEKVSRASAQLPTYLETKAVLDKNVAQVRIATQLSRLSGDITGVLATQYVLIDRDGIYSQCAFLPFKNPEDLEMNQSSVRRILGEQLVFHQNNQEAEDIQEITPGGIDMNRIFLQKEQESLNVQFADTIDFFRPDDITGFYPVILQIQKIVK